jgi:hypothetical protein
MILLDSKPNLFKLRLASKKKIFFLSHIEMKELEFMFVNKHKMYLDKMSIQLKMEFSASIWDSSMFYFGKDYNSGKPVIENMSQNKFP